MWLPVLGLLLGITVGLVFGLSVPAAYARYVAIAILAGLDSVMGAIRSETEGRFNDRVFLSGFFFNALLAGFLTYLADRLGVELYLAAIVAFGVRLFNNLAIIRRRLLVKSWREESA